MPTTITKTVKASGGDYTSLAAALAGEVRDLVAADEICRIECFDIEDTAAAVISASWTTDATRYVEIVAGAGNEAQAIGWNASRYRLYLPGGGSPFIIQNFADYTRLTNLQISSQQATIITNDAGTGLRMRGCRVRGVAGWVSDMDSGLAQGAGTAYVINCIFENLFVDTGTRGAGIFGVNFSTTYAYNNTFIDCNFSLQGYNNDTIAAKNNLAKNAPYGTGEVSMNYTGATNNASDDASTPGANARTSQTFTFEASVADDYRLSNSDAGAKGYGADLSADANFAFSDDIDGNARSAPWDIGAAIAVAGGGGAVDSDARAFPRGIGKGFNRGLMSAMKKVNGLWQPKDSRLIIPVGISLQGA